MSDISNYAKIRDDANRYYQKIGNIRCPAFNHEIIHFNSEGFNHLIYKSGNHERSKRDQVMKFKLLSKAKDLLVLTTTYQEFEESLMTIRKKRFKRRIEETTTVKYWGFVAIIKNLRIKVIVRQIGNGQKHFWSVIPAWLNNHYRNLKVISQAKGDLTVD